MANPLRVWFGVGLAAAGMILAGATMVQAQRPEGGPGRWDERRGEGRPGGDPRNQDPGNGFNRGPYSGGPGGPGFGGPGGPGFGGPGFGGPGGPGFGGRGGGEDRAQRIETMLRSLDKNGDGIISPNELEGPQKQMFERMAQRAGLNPSGPIAVTTLRDGMMKAAQQGPPGGDPRGGPGRGPGGAPAGQGGAQPAAVNGFGSATPSQPTVQGFGPPAATPARPGMPAATPAPSPTATPAQSPPGSGDTPSPEQQQRVRAFAESMLRQYDKNKNGVLEREEWSEMRGNMKEADKNGDGIITLDELTVHLMAYSQRRGDFGGRSGPGAPGGPNSNASSSNPSGATADTRKSYRFLTAQERLPKGLPDWFIRKDVNGDGQVSMAEYASVWSEAMVEEFKRYDLNNDGIITPAEVMAVMNQGPSQSLSKK